jgi:predicted DNA-binding transcriptional regulator YafY
LLPEFEVAFIQRQHLQFDYRDAKGVNSMRLVEPQAMLILPPLWYLVVWDPARDDFRHFRMDRIQRTTLYRRKDISKKACRFRRYRSTSG